MDESKILKIVKNAYDKIACDYASAYDSMDEQDWVHWNKFIEACQGEKVLDMGCGVGSATKYLFEQGCLPSGIDFSREMIDIAKKQCDEISWYEGDICKCPFEDQSFKGIVLSYTLNHLNNEMMDKLKKEIERLLVPNGVLLLVYHVGDGEEICQDPLDDTVSIYYHYYQKNYFEKLFVDYEEIDYYQRRSMDESELLNDKAIITYRKRGE